MFSSRCHKVLKTREVLTKMGEDSRMRESATFQPPSAHMG
ncbi:hypothetical protein ABI_31260 [Asticcacaulis biprosthecium C19]|uniref:Uncharacterized protein n=1 Tax=Asticcacaulis biprosthecium C19 TaxID=715226 RepID=F4QRI7_9CAUL|nr:hypothetical protein ABI_31260 [Asticcacaulis biprosthecium C19]